MNEYTRNLQRIADGLWFSVTVYYEFDTQGAISIEDYEMEGESLSRAELTNIFGSTQVQKFEEELEE